MTIFQALTLSIIEGLTEFLPVSSTGHLVLASQILGIAPTEFVKSFEIIIQLGAIMAIVWIYWKKVLARPELIRPILIAFFPTAVAGFTLYPLVKSVLLENTAVTAASLFIGGVILIIYEKRKKDTIDSSSGRIRIQNDREQSKKIDSGSGAGMTIQQALTVGIFQSLAIVPGVSRAAATIIGGMFVGLSRAEAVEFSFLLAVPTIAAAAGLDAVQNIGILTQNFPVLLLGFAGSFITALIVVGWFLRYVQHKTLAVFGWYRITAALVFWIVFL